MTNSIWHTKDEKPKPYKVIFQMDDVVGYGVTESMPDDDYSQCRDSYRWCYVKDLLKLEAELEKFKIALCIAIERLDGYAKLHKRQPSDIPEVTGTYNAVGALSENTLLEIDELLADNKIRANNLADNKMQATLDQITEHGGFNLKLKEE